MKQRRPRSLEARNVIQADKQRQVPNSDTVARPVRIGGFTYAQMSLLDALEPTGERDASAAPQAFDLDEKTASSLTGS